MIPKFLIVALITFAMLSSENRKEQNQVSQNPLPECPGTPNCVRISESFSYDSTEVLDAFGEALRGMKASSIEWNSDTTQIQAEFTIPVFGWIDDVSIAVHNTDTGCIAHIRSASREGTWDIWVNPIRVNKLKKRVIKILSS